MHKCVLKTTGVKRLFKRKEHNEDASKPKADRFKQEIRHVLVEVR